MFVESVQEKEPAGGEGVREGETPAGESGGECTRPLQERIHRYQQRNWKKKKNFLKKLCNIANAPQRIHES